MNSEQYAEKIKDTRAGIDQTLHTLEDKLSPGELWDQALRWSEGLRDFSTNLGRFVRENPIPSTLMGFSLAWLMVASSRRIGQADISRMGSRLQGKYAEVKSSLRGTAEEAGDRMAGMTEDLRHRGEQLREQGQEWKESLLGQGQELKERLQSGTSELSARPVLLSALGLAIGAVVAMSLPVSRTEEEVIGEPGRRMYRKASQAVGEQLERGREAVSAAADAARDKFAGQGAYGDTGGQWTESAHKSPDDFRESTH
jgi:hypothetical protein